MRVAVAYRSLTEWVQIPQHDACPIRLIRSCAISSPCGVAIRFGASLFFVLHRQSLSRSQFRRGPVLHSYISPISSYVVFLFSLPLALVDLCRLVLDISTSVAFYCLLDYGHNASRFASGRIDSLFDSSRIASRFDFGRTASSCPPMIVGVFAIPAKIIRFVVKTTRSNHLLRGVWLMVDILMGPPIPCPRSCLGRSGCRAGQGGRVYR